MHMKSLKVLSMQDYLPANALKAKPNINEPHRAKRFFIGSFVHTVLLKNKSRVSNYMLIRLTLDRLVLSVLTALNFG